MKKAEKKLEELGKKILKDIKEGKNPNIDIPIRSLSNIIYDKKTRSLTLGGKVAKRYFFNVAHAKKFMQTLMIAAFCKDLLSQNIHTSLRDLFYALKRTLPNSKENTFDEQKESDPIIVDLEVALDVLREQLHLNADIRGRVVGNVKVRDRGDLVDWSKLGSGGWAIPSNVEDIKFKKVNANFILCLPSFEEIVAKVDGKFISKKIKNIYEDYLNKKNIFVVSFDKMFTPTFSKVLFMIKRKPKKNEKLYKIETRSGSYIFVSEDHKIPVITKDGIKNKNAKEINNGEYVLEAKDISLLSNESQNLKIDIINFILKYHPEKLNNIRVYGPPVKELLKNVKVCWWIKKSGELYQELINSWKRYISMPLSYYLKFEKEPIKRRELKLYFKRGPRKNSIPAIIDIDENFAKILGYYVAEGHIYNNIAFWTFEKDEKENQKELMKAIYKVFKIKPRVYRKSKKYSSVQIMCGNKIVGLVLHKMCGKNAYEKIVPTVIFNSSNKIKKVFIEYYLKGDGYIYKNLITFSTISERLVNQIRLLLRFMGIPSYKKVIKNNGGFKDYKKHLLYICGILKHHWKKERLSTSRSLWDKVPMFLFSEKHQIKKRYGYRILNIYSSKPKVNTTFIHPVAIRKIEQLDFNGDYFEIVVAEPFHVFLHSAGIFTHNCIEKNAAFERLHEDKFWKKHNCILLTTQGQAARGCRRLIQRLSEEFNLPVYVFCDSDPYGWYIYSVIKFGSMSLAHVSDRLGTPNAKFLGLTISDIDKFGLKDFTIKCRDVDIKRAKEMLKYEWFKDPAWQKELKLLIERKVKAELEALSGRGLKFMSEVYLPQKIKNKEFLP